ncbi:MAG: HipA domain-containing protein [Planctomycetota bacterium]
MTPPRAEARGNLRDVEHLDVYLGDARVGALRRTERGARFTYDEEWARRHAGAPDRSIALRMPVRAEPYESLGVNLHPFFAGLLPEGLRLRALVRAVKTSEDDLFSLLAAIGPDTVGDVSLTAPGELPADRSTEAQAGAWSELRFRALLERSLSLEGTRTHSSVAGVQPKVSAAMISFPVRKRGGRVHYLLKLSPPELPRLVENEAFFMAAARAVGLRTAPVELVRDATGEVGLAVERFDRVARPDGTIERVHQEDICQLLERYPADKYRLKLQDVSDALAFTSAPVVARLELLRLQAFSYAIGNGDLHARNFSVSRRAGLVATTPAYDLCSTLPYGDAKLALALEGRDERLTWKHFVAFGERNGVRAASIRRVLTTLVQRLGPCAARLSEIGLDAKATRHLERTMRTRLAALDPGSASVA